jgi:hypothetical protein
LLFMGCEFLSACDDSRNQFVMRIFCQIFGLREEARH